MSGARDRRKDRDWVEHVDQTLPGAYTPPIREDWPTPSHADTGPARHLVDEEDVRAVRERILDDLLVFPPDLHVRAREGVLVLEGRASTPQEHKRVELLAREIVGNATIENRMVVGR